MNYWKETSNVSPYTMITFFKIFNWLYYKLEIASCSNNENLTTQDEVVLYVSLIMPKSFGKHISTRRLHSS